MLQKAITEVLFEFEKTHNVVVSNVKRVWLLDRLLRTINAVQQSVQTDGGKPSELREDDDSCQCLMCGDVHRRR